MGLRSLAGLVVLIGSVPAAGATMTVEVAPPAPDATTPITLFTRITLGDTGYESDHTTWSMAGGVINVSWYIRDLHGSGQNFVQILTPYEGQADVGLLPPSAYEIHASLYMSTYPVYSFYTLADFTTGTFQVVPEPASLGLLIPALVLRRPRRRR